MKICIFGAGAIGSFLAAHLAQVKTNTLTLIARGPQLEAIQARGLELTVGDQTLHARVPAVPGIRDLKDDRPDIVFVTLKSHGMTQAADDLVALSRTGTIMVFACNGLPWWYGSVTRKPLDAHHLAAMDEALMSQRMDMSRVVGCVSYSPNTIVSPGVVRCASTTSRFMIGPVGMPASQAADEAASLLQEAGLSVPPSRDILAEVWKKLLLNAALSPLSVLTGGNNHDITGNEELRSIAWRIVQEVVQIAAAEGIDLAHDPSMLLPANLPPHKPSMLQDLERRQRLETDSILDRVLVMAQATGVPTPALHQVSVLAKARSALSLKST